MAGDVKVVGAEFVEVEVVELGIVEVEVTLLEVVNLDVVELEVVESRSSKMERSEECETINECPLHIIYVRGKSRRTGCQSTV